MPWPPARPPRTRDSESRPPSDSGGPDSGSESESEPGGIRVFRLRLLVEIQKRDCPVVKPAIKSEFVAIRKSEFVEIPLPMLRERLLSVSEFFSRRHRDPGAHLLWFFFAGLEKMADVENVDDDGADRKPITLHLAIFYCCKFIRR